MIKNNGCCDLEYAKKIKELGVKQEGLFKWHSKLDGKGNRVYTEIVYLPIKQMEQDYSAFTVAELLNVLTEIKRCDRIIPSGIDNVANFLAQEVINEKEREKKN